MTYIILFFSLLIYLVPIVSSSENVVTSHKARSNFYIISGLELLFFFTSPILFFIVINYIFFAPSITAWFGHIIFSSFQSKILYLVSLIFYIFIIMFLSPSYMSSNEIYDFLIAQFNTYYWVTFLFFANSLFTVIFIIEVLSTLIFLLITTSVFSTTFFYKNISFDSKIFLQNNLPSTFIQSLLFFFWVSLVSSLNLFVFLILLHNSVLTFDWFLLEHIFFYVLNISHLKDILTIGLVWFIIMFSIFLKCGIVPLFLWKPTFFKGLSFNMLIFYIVFFYFFLFLFFINFLSIYFNSLFYFYSFISVLFVLIGLFFLFFILCEAFYLKIFFAVSSILNSLLVILALLAAHNVDFMFFL
jgi:hypothetical protein